MRFRLPKPLHGWSEFIHELIIVVLGVLIALGAGQVADAIHWKFEAQQSLSLIKLELAHDAGVFDERVMVQPCLDKRLAEVDALVRGARKTGVLPQIGEIGHPPWRPIETAAWDNALISGVPEHFDPETRDILSNYRAQLVGNQADLEEENMLWASLRSIENAPGPVSESILANISDAIAKLRYRSGFNGGNANQQLDKIKSGLGVEPSYVIVLDVEGSRKDVETHVERRPVCRPLLVDGKPYRLAPTTP
jgi:hypothetical protein